MKKILIPLILVILAASSFFVWRINTQSSPHSTNSQTKKVKPLPKEVTITLGKEGFKPNTVTIQVGSAVRWKNVSGDKQTVNSDDYPTNQKHKELNFGIFNAGSSVVYTFTKPGRYRYHNQLHPEQKGEIIVTK